MDLCEDFREPLAARGWPCVTLIELIGANCGKREFR